MKPSFASISRDILMVDTCKLMFCRAPLLLTLKVEMFCRLLMPWSELSPVLVIRTLSAWVIPVSPNDIDCKAGSAVKFMLPTVVNLGKESVERTVSPPSSKPPIEVSWEKARLARLIAFDTVKLPVIA